MSIVFSFSWELKWPHKKLKTMLMQNFGLTNKDYYGMLWYFLEWSIRGWPGESGKERGRGKVFVLVTLRLRFFGGRFRFFYWLLRSYAGVTGQVTRKTSRLKLCRPNFSVKSLEFYQV